MASSERDTRGKITHQVQYSQPLLEVGKANREALGHATKDGRVDVIWAVGGTEDHYSVGAGHEAVP